MRVRAYLLAFIALVALLPLWWLLQTTIGGQLMVTFNGATGASLVQFVSHSRTPTAAQEQERQRAVPTQRGEQATPIQSQSLPLPATTARATPVPSTHAHTAATVAPAAATTTAFKKIPSAQEEIFEYPIRSQCGTPPYRNFQTHPILILGSGYPEGHRFHKLRCDVPCLYTADYSLYGRSADGTMVGGALCPHQRGVSFTMENVPDIKADAQTYSMNVKATSDVPVPYYSWSDFSIMQPMTEKTNPAMASAFVSNCVLERKEVIEGLMKEGITVHSFGACVHNKEESDISNKEGKYTRKIDIMSKYKVGIVLPLLPVWQNV